MNLHKVEHSLIESTIKTCWTEDPKIQGYSRNNTDTLDNT